MIRLWFSTIRWIAFRDSRKHRELKAACYRFALLPKSLGQSGIAEASAEQSFWKHQVPSAENHTAVDLHQVGSPWCSQKQITIQSSVLRRGLAYALTDAASKRFYRGLCDQSAGLLSETRRFCSKVHQLFGDRARLLHEIVGRL